MSATDLKRWMDSTGKTVIDIASLTKIDPKTIRGFLDTGHASDSTKNHLALMVRMHSKEPGGTAA